ncbi:MAG: guanylate kinase [Planctomycetota bacterium]|jgi:guanylate kinase
MTETAERGLLVVISGPSGVGKTTIAHQVERRLGGVFSVSATTRPKTDADVEGRDYYFLSDEEFTARREAGDFLEWAEVFGKHRYGTPRGPVERQLAEGRLVILEIDVQGGVQVREAMPDAFLVFILPPTEETLLERLRGRGREDEAAIRRRFEEARREIELVRRSGVYDEFIVNDDLEPAIAETCRRIDERRRDPAAGAAS